MKSLHLTNYMKTNNGVLFYEVILLYDLLNNEFKIHNLTEYLSVNRTAV